MQRFLTMTQVSERLGGRSRSSLYNDMKEGRLPKPIKIGARNYWPERELERYLTQQAQRETDELIDEARATGRSIDDLYSERHAG